MTHPVPRRTTSGRVSVSSWVASDGFFAAPAHDETFLSLEQTAEPFPHDRLLFDDQDSEVLAHPAEG